MEQVRHLEARALDKESDRVLEDSKIKEQREGVAEEVQQKLLQKDAEIKDLIEQAKAREKEVKKE